MNTDGQNITNVFRQARQVCEQGSLLLQTADEQMKRVGWKSDKSTAISEISWSILSPRQWIPVNAFRFYSNQEKYPARLACISVLFSDHFDERYKIREPIVTGICFDYGKSGEKFDWDYEYWYARYFGYASESKHLEANSEPVEFDNKKLEQDLQVNFEKGVMFAVPLVSLRNAQDVKLQVTDKLLNLLTK